VSEIFIFYDFVDSIIILVKLPFPLIHVICQWPDFSLTLHSYIKYLIFIFLFSQTLDSLAYHFGKRDFLTSFKDLLIFFRGILYFCTTVLTLLPVCCEMLL
jgi:hypothetical protein